MLCVFAYNNVYIHSQQIKAVMHLFNVAIVYFLFFNVASLLCFSN
jgi:hypothetical protein